MFTPTSASLESVTRRQVSAKAESKESHALIISSVTKLLHADLLLFGHMRLNACQWQMLARSVRLSLIANQGISAGN